MTEKSPASGASLAGHAASETAGLVPKAIASPRPENVTANRSRRYSIESDDGPELFDVLGVATLSKSAGDVTCCLERVAYGTGWTGLSYQERLSGSQALFLYAASLVVVFLVLAALYESWIIPLSVLLAGPVGIFGALMAAYLFGQSNDVYFKVGLLTTMGLTAKNAILIVEFARDLRGQGRSLLEAVLEAVRVRLRPIAMTSIAFLLGVLPLAIATGAGSGAQNSVGIGVVGGTLAGTLIGIFFVPLFFVLVSGGVKRDKKEQTAASA